MVNASHVFEHLARHQTGHFLSEAMRVLAPGGVIRLVVPDLQSLARVYVAGAEAGDPEASRQFLHWVNMHQDATYAPTASRPKRLIATWQGFPHQHKYMYDEHSLRDVLGRAGFADLRGASHGSSAWIDDIGLLEQPGSGVDSVYVEARKSGY